MYKLESVLENETHKVFRDFEILTDHLISARRPDLKKKKKKKKKKNLFYSRLCRPGRTRSKIKRKQKEL